MNYDPIPTIVPQPGLDNSGIKNDAKVLRMAISSHDANAVIKLLTTHSNSQRILIREAYEEEFSSILYDDLKAEFQGDFKLLASGLVLKPMEYVANCIGSAFGRSGLNVKIIAEMLAPYSNSELDQMKNFYKEFFKRELKEQIHAETSGSIRLLFLNILENCRGDETMNVDIANRRAVELLAVLEVTPEKFEKYFICLITRENFQMLRTILYEYEKLNSDLSIDRLIELNYNGDLRVAVKTVVDVIRHLPNYFAIRINKAMEGWVSDFPAIMRIFTSRAEIDLGNIKKEYARIFQKELARDIKSNTSGEQRRCLLAMLGKE